LLFHDVIDVDEVYKVVAGEYFAEVRGYYVLDVSFELLVVRVRICQEWSVFQIMTSVALNACHKGSLYAHV
jgi:hypothetical protein